MAFSVTEKSSSRYTATLLDEDGNPVGVSVMTSLRLWLRDVATQDYINSRENQNILNTNNVTFAAGVLTWELQPADNIIVGSGTPEEHEAVFYATWTDGSGGARARSWAVTINVTNYVPLT